LGLDEDFEKSRTNFYTKRTDLSSESLSLVDTGMLDKKTFGFEVRPVNMSRGNKEGTNAFANSHTFGR